MSKGSAGILPAVARASCPRGWGRDCPHGSRRACPEALAERAALQEPGDLLSTDVRQPTPTPASDWDIHTHQDKELVKGLGFDSCTMLVMGSMIGSGIFIVSADIARQVKSPALLIGSWLVTGFVTIVGALSYGELAAMMPRAGGQYVYLREALGPLWGFLYGWTLFLVIQTGDDRGRRHRLRQVSRGVLVRRFLPAQLAPALRSAAHM